MEDSSVFMSPFISDTSLLLAVFDGHVGTRCSNYLSNVIPMELRKQTKQIQSVIPSKETFYNVFDSTDQRWLESVKGNKIEDGSTALCVALDGPDLVVANCGDSRAILCQAGQTTALTRDHKPTDYEENQRILVQGGTVIGGRLQGKLGVSRAFGNYEFKESRYLSSEPEVIQVKLTDEAEFLVVGCDGLYERFSNEEIVKFIKTGLLQYPLQDVVQELVAEAIDRGSEDNITVIVVKFEKAYRKLLRKRARKSAKSAQNLIPLGKGISLVTSGKTSVKTIHSESPSPPEPAKNGSLFGKKEPGLALRTSGKSNQAEPSVLLSLSVQTDSKSRKTDRDHKKSSKSSKSSPSPPPRSPKHFDSGEDKYFKSHSQGGHTKSSIKHEIFGRAVLTKSG
jgi:serine/threonine protein phosphatase PrpC